MSGQHTQDKDKAEADSDSEDASDYSDEDDPHHHQRKKAVSDRKKPPSKVRAAAPDLPMVLLATRATSAPSEMRTQFGYYSLDSVALV